MARYSFQSPEYTRICSLAETLWREFLDRLKSVASLPGDRSWTEYAIARRLLHTDSDVSDIATRFAHFCCIIKQPERLRSCPTYEQLQEIDVNWVKPFGFKGVSWLHHIDDRRLSIHLSEHLLDRGNPDHARLATWLVIHEVGHVMTSWPLMKSLSSPAYARDSTPEQEMHAWWFCHSIKRLAAGAYAFGLRSEGGADDTGTVI